MSETASARRLVLDLLVRQHTQAAYSTIVLDHALRASALSAQDRSFAAALFYAVLERRLTLDAVIARYSTRPLERLAPVVLECLRMGVCQLLYLDGVPDSAAVNESVKLVQEAGQQRASGFVNAVLRSFLRADKRLPKGKTPTEALSLTYSCPEWLVERFLLDYGEEKTHKILMASLGRAPITARVNTQKTSMRELAELLASEGIDALPHPQVPDCLILSRTGSVEGLQAYRDGLFHVQDVSSQLCCAALAPKPGERVLDLCAAPGGKSFTMAQLMEGKGEVLSFDLHEKRVRLIEEGASRLGLSSITAKAGDAKEFNPSIPQADRVLCDVPCSGWGVIRRKPEMKYKPSEEWKPLPAIQLAILRNAARYVRPRGYLLYSTCTLNRAENDEVVDAFLGENVMFEPEEFSLHGRSGAFSRLTLLPSPDGGDGFFLALFRHRSRD